MTRIYIIQKVALCLAVSATLAGCIEENEEVIPYTESDNVITFPGNTSLDASFTEIDPITIPFQVDGSATSVDVVSEDGATNYGTVSVANGEGTFTSSLADLGLDGAGDDVDLRFVVTESDGSVVRYPFTVEITDPISLTAPEGVVQNNEVNYFYYDITTASASVENITVERKVGSRGDYTPLTQEGGFSTDSDSVVIVGANYAVGDTVFTQVSVTSGGLTSMSEASTVIGVFRFANENDEVMLDSTMVAYDLVAAADTTSGAPVADVEFALGSANQIGFRSANGATFVAVGEDEDLYSAGNQVAVINAYEAGTPVSEVTDVEEGDTFIYRTARGEAVSYGIIQVTNVERTNDDNTDSFSFTYKY